MTKIYTFLIPNPGFALVIADVEVSTQIMLALKGNNSLSFTTTSSNAQRDGLE